MFLNRTVAVAFAVGILFCAKNVSAQTDGSARLQVRILDYNGSGTKHWSVVWVTKADGTFIKTLWKRGPNITSSHWNSHCSKWYSAKAGSTAIDGVSAATAPNYSSPYSPVDLTWNCRDAGGTLVPDGDYKFWVQYAEDSGQGPYTTSGLLWTKSTSSTTYDYPNQGSNFSGMQVLWTSLAPPPPPVPPAFAACYMVDNALHMTGTGTVHETYYVMASTNLDLPVEEWTCISTNQIDGLGNFSNTAPAESQQTFYRLLIP